MARSMRLKAGLLLVSATALSILAPISALAATDTTTVDLTITGGNLSIDSPNSTVSFTGVSALTSAQQTATAVLEDITIADLRGTAAGWNATAKYKNLRGATKTSEYILLANAAGADPASKYLNIQCTAATTISGGNSGLTSYTAKTDISQVSALDNTGESNALNILSASAGNGAGTYSTDCTNELKIPAYGQYLTTSGTPSISGDTYSSVSTFEVS